MNCLRLFSIYKKLFIEFKKKNYIKRTFIYNISQQHLKIIYFTCILYNTLYNIQYKLYTNFIKYNANVHIYVIYIYSKINYVHQFSTFIYTYLYMKT